MADEDEVDILGDFPFENLFQKEDSRISSCYDGSVLGAQSADQLLQDCINPSWLLESSQHCWLSPTLDERQRCSPAVTEERSSLTSPWEEHDSWSEREKSLLEKGTELFGRSWTRVSQFVGTKTPLQVRSQAAIMGLSEAFRVSESSEHEEEVIESTSLDVESKTTPSFTYTELYDDMAIPASMEEVISVVTTAQLTVIDTSPTSPSPPAKRQKKVANSLRPTQVNKPRSAKVQLKFPTKKGRPKKTESLMVPVAEQEPPDPGICPEEEEEILESIITESIDERKPTGPIIFVSEGEELIRIQKSTEDSEDSEIDIDDDEGGDLMLPKVTVTSDQVESAAQSVPIVQEPEIEVKCESKSDLEDKVSYDYEEKPPVETEKVFNFSIPTQELVMDLDVITDEEKAVHFEFFTGRPTKTPARYLKIRNHILEIWKDCKPTFVSKTQVRNGLKNCGDVNAIGRIHAYLEQIGAINFGCEQAMYKPIVIPTGNKKVVSVAAKVRMESKPLTLRSDGTRPRKKRVEQMDSDGEGGYTITHDEHGSAILTKVYKEQSNTKCGKGKKSPQNEHHRLVYCHKFSDHHKAPFSVILDIGALLLMDVHAHSSRSEVIGLLGGSFDARTKKLHISRAVACKSQSTGVQCDMCPVSQTEASEVIQYAGLEVVGWYHSHPTFLPNPSVQDMETQVRVQNWFEKTDAPFVGMIVAPYYNGNKTLASSYKCLTMTEEEGDTKPYQFPVMVAPSQSYSESLLRRIEDVFLQMDHDQGSAVVPFDQPTFPNSTVTYLEKVVESARIHIDRCYPALSLDQRSSLLSGIIDLCERNTKPKAALLE
ncbi:histone H2A deubiquitinase MYSM1-like isoform X2 [Cloeon dipterum]|uniref:histone H2A deubiquitinase MYSM1-like isoform X2 n=1 Tax=Cloeon dipterum TaxID=197152 RepID=UPI00321FFE54